MIPKNPEIGLRAVNDFFRELPYGNDYPVPGVVGIYVHSEEQRRQLKSLADDVTQYTRALLSALQRDERYMQEAVVGGRLVSEQMKLFKSKGATETPFLLRVDCLWDGERFWICEVNSDAVGGIEDAYFLHKAYRENIDLVNVSGGDPLAGVQLANYLLNHYGQRSRGLVVYTDAVCRNAGGRLARLLRLQGVNVESVHLNELEEYIDGVRWIWRHLLLTDLFEEESNSPVPTPSAKAVEYFLSCCGRNDLDVLSPIRDRLLFDKRFLCEEMARKYVSSEVWDTLAKWIPESHLMSYRDMEHDSALPDGWVLKPARGFGGIGVRFAGDSMPTREEAARDEWIWQRLIDSERIEVFSGQTELYYAVHGAHILAGELLGDHLRVGPTRLARGSSGYIPVYCRESLC